MRHVSAGAMALYREGEVSRRKAAQISRHLSGCSQCAGVNSALATVTGVLAAVRRPQYPDSAAARLQGALRSEAAARAAQSPGLAAGRSRSGTSAGDVVPPVRVPGRPDLPGRPGRSWRLRAPGLSSPLVLRGLAAAAVVVLLSGVGYVIASGQQSSGSAASASSPGPGGPRLSGPQRAAVQRGTVGLRYERDGKLATTVAIASGVDFRPGTLAAQIRHEVAARPTTFVGNSPAAPKPIRSPAATGVSQQFGGISVRRLDACLSRVAAGREVLLVEVAFYRGSPATIIVTATSPASRDLDISVVSPACSAVNADVITHVEAPGS